MTDKILSGISLAVVHAGEMRQLGMHLNYHLNQGVERIFLFLDRPEVRFDEFFSASPKIEIEYCDQAFWRAQLGSEPPSLEEKQTWAVRESSRRAANQGLEFLGFVDSDELIYGTRPLKATLSKLEKSVGAIRLPVLEARLTENDRLDDPLAASRFVVCDRSGAHDELIAGVYGQAARHLRGGFYGHSAGKTIYRLPMAYREVGVHRPKPESGSPLVATATDFSILHFDCGSLNTWLAKWGSRASGHTRSVNMEGPRIQQLEDIREAILEGEEAIARFFASSYRLTTAQEARLAEAGLLRCINIPRSAFESPLAADRMAGVFTMNEEVFGVERIRGPRQNLPGL